jgi:hypothetical protein
MSPKKGVVLVGNLSDGFTAYGPYDSFDEACAAHENEESWVMTLEEPKNSDGAGVEYRSECCPSCGSKKVVRAYNDKGQWDGWELTCKSCDTDF